MTRFQFCLTTGAEGYVPDDQQYVDAACAVDAFDAIKAAIRDFLLFEENAFEDADWKGFFERGCRMPDASTWNFTLARGDKVSLSLVGMTEAEFERESAE